MLNMARLAHVITCCLHSSYPCFVVCDIPIASCVASFTFFQLNGFRYFFKVRVTATLFTFLALEC